MSVADLLASLPLHAYLQPRVISLRTRGLPSEARGLFFELKKKEKKMMLWITTRHHKTKKASRVFLYFTQLS